MILNLLKIEFLTFIYSILIVMDSFNCHYCNNPILTNRIGFGKNEYQVVTGDIRVCNNLIAKECLPFHPIGSIILCFEEDMLDIVAKKKKSSNQFYYRKMKN